MHNEMVSHACGGVKSKGLPYIGPIGHESRQTKYASAREKPQALRNVSETCETAERQLISLLSDAMGP